MIAEPKHPLSREPGDDAVYDGITAGSFVDALDFEKSAAAKATRHGMEDVVDLILADSTCHPRQSQSPLEEKMFAALVGCGFSSSKDPSVERLATIYQQRAIRTRRGLLHVDYAAIRQVGNRTVKAVLELDGHEFHQKTKDQVDRDYGRNRALAREGWIVVRFTGSEVFRDAGACALEFAGIIIEAINRIAEGT